MGTMHVTPEVLRTTKQEMESYMAEAMAIVNQYMATHQDAMGVAWAGPAGVASETTAAHLQHELQQTTEGFNGLAHGLGNAADLVEQHEDERARTMSSFAYQA